jgi:hypothetical protein
MGNYDDLKGHNPAAEAELDELDQATLPEEPKVDEPKAETSSNTLPPATPVDEAKTSPSSGKKS